MKLPNLKSTFGCLLLLMISLIALPAQAQREGNIWYFGVEAGMDFNTGVAAPLTDGAMSTYEGCASISDQQGNLQFYTDGITIYNSLHVPMVNGTGLLGDPSASQSGVIVRIPGTLDRYYVFSVDNDGGGDGLRYSQVDMTMNGGLGAVVFKNVLLTTPVTEKISAVVHGNGLDIWVLAHGWNSNEYYAYLVTPFGIQPPVVSTIGMVHGGSPENARGCLKVSPNGKKVAAAVAFEELVELFDFNDTTGVLSNLLTIPNIAGAFGVEFSPSGRYLYISTVDVSPGELYQFRVDLATGPAILASRIYIGRTTSISMGALQLGPDRRIYAARFGGTYLGVIEYPDSNGLGCSYIDNGFFLDGKISRLGLPSFIQSYFLPPVAGFNYSVPCLGDSTLFFGSTSYGPVDWDWDFGDPASGPANTSNVRNPMHSYTSAGTYTVTLIISRDTLADTVSHEITVHDYPPVEINPSDTIVCEAPSLTIDPGGPAAFYMWNTGENTQSITVFSDGTYIVEAGNGPCRITDSIVVDFRPRPFLDLGQNQKICEGDSVVLDGGNPGGEYVWSNGDTTQQVSVTETGSYWCEVTTGACSTADTMFLLVLPYPQLDLGADRSWCRDEVKFTVPSGSGVIWSDGSTDASITVRETGLYWAEVANDICVIRDSVYLELFAPVRENLGNNLEICPGNGDSLLLIAQTPNASYSWSTGETTREIWVKQPGQYDLSVISADGCTGGTSTVVRANCAPQIFIPNAFTPNGDGVNDFFDLSTLSVQEFNLRLFDRWGREIFTSNDVKVSWDGKDGGMDVPEGTYIYALEFVDGNGNPGQLAGSVILYR